MTAIVTENLTLARGGATLLSDISLTLGPHGSVAVVGPNGAGKSMLLKTLAGIEKAGAGTVRLGDRQLAQIASAARAREIGYLPQHFEPHWDLTVADLVALGAERGDRPKDAAETAIVAFELASIRHRHWSTLSGGERARVLLAMVLAPDPPVLLADEPGASLDIRHRLALIKALARRGSDHLAVVVMHDLNLAFRFFDRVVVVAGGRVVADAAARAVFEDRRLDAAFGVEFARREINGRFLLDTD